MSDTAPSTEQALASVSRSRSPSAAPVDAAEAARLKREARKARILSKGSDRLARITNTGRGEGASAYLNDNTTPLPCTPAARPAAAASAPAAVAVADDDDPLEVDISTLPPRQNRLEGDEAPNPFGMFGGGLNGTSGQNPMEALMAMMQGGLGGPGAGGADGAPGGQADMSGLPPQLAAMMQQFGAAPGAAGGAAGLRRATATKSTAERCFDVLQAVLVLALAVFAVKSSLVDLDRSGVMPPTMGDSTTSGGATLAPTLVQRWAALGYQQPRPIEWSTISARLPLFWIFVSLEVVLQASRILMFSRKSPPPPSLLSTLTSMLPIRNLHLALTLAAKYVALLNALVNDVCLLAFVFGSSVLWSSWMLGGTAMLDHTVNTLVHNEL